MTNEEAREQLKDIARSFSREYFFNYWREALDVAIKALEQQPSEDCISREEAKQFLYERIDRLNDDELYDIFSRIIDDMYNELPSVTPTSEDIKEAYLKGYDYGVKDWFKSKTQPCKDAVSKQIRDCENCIHHKDGCCEVWECKFEAKEEKSEDSDEETESEQKQKSKP